MLKRSSTAEFHLLDEGHCGRAVDGITTRDLQLAGTDAHRACGIGHIPARRVERGRCVLLMEDRFA